MSVRRSRDFTWSRKSLAHARWRWKRQRWSSLPPLRFWVGKNLDYLCLRHLAARPSHWRSLLQLVQGCVWAGHRRRNWSFCLFHSRPRSSCETRVCAPLDRWISLWFRLRRLCVLRLGRLVASARYCVRFPQCGGSGRACRNPGPGCTVRQYKFGIRRNLQRLASLGCLLANCPCCATHCTRTRGYS